MGNISIAGKLGLGFGIVIFFSFVLAITGWLGLINTIDSSDKMVAIQSLNKVISDTKAARENYLRSMKDNDKQVLGDNIELMTSILEAEKSKYSNATEAAILDEAISHLIEYKTIYENLTQLIDSKAEKSAEVIQLAQSITDMQSQNVEVMKSSIEGVNWQAIAEINAITIKMKQMDQDARNWFLLDTADQTMYEKLKQNGGEIITKLQTITSQYQLANTAKTIKSESKLLELYGQLVKINLSVNALTEKYGAVALELRQNVTEMEKQQRDRQASTGLKAKTFLVSVYIATLIIGIFATLYITKLIANPMHETAEAAARIAKGDLTNELKSSRKDEVGMLQDAIGQMTRSLKELIGNVSEGISEISSAASQLSAVTEQNQKGMRKQHIEIEQVAAAMNEMTTTVH